MLLLSFQVGRRKALSQQVAGRGMASEKDNDTATLYSLFAVSLLYFWLSLFALREALTTVWRTREKEKNESKNTAGGLSISPPPLNLYLPFHFATFCHSTIRWVLLVLAYFMDTSKTPTSCDAVCELRRTVLGDIPGFIFVGLYVWLCMRMQNSLSKYEVSSRKMLRPSPPSSKPGSTTSTPLFMPNDPAVSTTILSCTQATIRALLSGTLFSAVLAWMVILVFMSQQDLAQSSLQLVSSIRDSIFFLLFVVELVLSLLTLRWLVSVDHDESFVVRRLESPPGALRKVLVCVVVSFIVRCGALIVVFAEGTNGTGIPVLILPGASASQLALTVSYYVLCEIFCGYVAVYLLRHQVFGEDHEPLMERLLLPSQLEIDSDEVRVIDALGSGGYGVVYHAEFRGLPVAVKKFYPGPSDPFSVPAYRSSSKNNTYNNYGTNNGLASEEWLSPTAKRRLRVRFVQEAKILCSLRHPRIVTLIGYTYFPTERSFALVMELMPKGSLFDLLHRSNEIWTFGDALRHAAAVADGMAYLHASGIIHRDLKSANILVDEGLNPKICDFGLSKQFGFSSMAVSAPSAHGTVSWSAPELLSGEKFGPSVDVYSWAVVFCETLSRRVPHYEKQTSAVILGVLGNAEMRPQMPASRADRGEIGMNHSLAKVAEDKVFDIMVSAWSSNPQQRPSFREIIADLHSCLKNAPSHLLRESIPRARSVI